MNDEVHEQRKFKAQNARQGRIVLKTRKQRIIFAAGLAAIVLLAFIALF